jgi:hypothetical protein
MKRTVLAKSGAGGVVRPDKQEKQSKNTDDKQQSNVVIVSGDSAPISNGFHAVPSAKAPLPKSKDLVPAKDTRVEAPMDNAPTSAICPMTNSGSTVNSYSAIAAGPQKFIPPAAHPVVTAPAPQYERPSRGWDTNGRGSYRGNDYRGAGNVYSSGNTYSSGSVYPARQRAGKQSATVELFDGVHNVIQSPLEATKIFCAKGQACNWKACMYIHNAKELMVVADNDIDRALAIFNESYEARLAADLACVKQLLTLMGSLKEEDMGAMLDLMIRSSGAATQAHLSIRYMLLKYLDSVREKYV